MGALVGDRQRFAETKAYPLADVGVPFAASTCADTLVPMAMPLLVPFKLTVAASAALRMLFPLPPSTGVANSTDAARSTVMVPLWLLLLPA